jgi:hypothetical protein
MEHPAKCLICGKHPMLDDDGAHLEEVYVYQRIDGKLQLAKEIVLHQPLYFIHAECYQ